MAVNLAPAVGQNLRAVLTLRIRCLGRRPLAAAVHWADRNLVDDPAGLRVYRQSLADLPVGAWTPAGTSLTWTAESCLSTWRCRAADRTAGTRRARRPATSRP